MDFHTEWRQNATHQLRLIPNRVVKKGAGKDARLYYPESVLIENRNGVMIDLSLVGPLGGPNVTKVGLVANGARAAPDHVGGDKGC